jgi:hypothetical protein
MIDLLYAVAACGDAVGSWDLTGQAGRFVLRVRSRGLLDTEPAAVEVAERMVKGLLPAGFDAVSTAVSTRQEGSAPSWRGVAELVVRAAR